MKHSVKHDIGIDLAKRATLAAFESYRERFAKYHPTANWVDDRNAEIAFSAKGMTLKGKLTVNESSIDMDLDVPFVMRPFKSMALSAVEREIETWVERARRSEI